MTLLDISPDAPIAARVDALIATLAAADDAGYIGEPVSQLAHGLQAAARAEATGDEALALAALLHDIGHLVDPQAPQMHGLGTVDHERIGRAVCDRLGFAPRVGRLVERHVDAKRYLARRASYRARLSPASTGTLAFQGGPMSDAEAAAFEAEPDHKAILRLRTWDEAAKDPAAEVPGLDHWRPIITRHLERQGLERQSPERQSLERQSLERQQIDRVLAPLRRPLSAEQRAAWARDHLLVLPGLLDGEALRALEAWTADLQTRPETPGKWMKYFERGTEDRQLCRVEDFVPYHAGFAALLCGEPLMDRLAELMGQPACLFKEKINYKLPGGSGFTAHQDAPAFDAFGHRYHVTVLIAVDPQTRQNGGLEFAAPVAEGVLLPQRADRSVAAEVEAGLSWAPLDLPAGSVAFFDSYIPHRSGPNRSESARRGLYVTYNRAADGDRRADYFADKRATFPPEVEREPGVDYLARAGRYNVGNPIR